VFADAFRQLLVVFRLEVLSAIAVECTHDRLLSSTASDYAQYVWSAAVRYVLPVQPVETSVVEALRAGDEAAFTMLVREYGPTMLRVAGLYVGSRAVAEEVVQEAWLGVLNGIRGFEGRSSLKTWIFRILTNIAKTRGQREGRSIPFSALAADEAAGPSVDPGRFLADGRWASPPRSWGPEEQVLGEETLKMVDASIAELPPSQAIVITMRDVQGFSAEETRNALDISETNQRVLLHRARSKVRQALEDYLG
jgi:RNA polymerase sigma-70 factor, ECF subfamily